MKSTLVYWHKARLQNRYLLEMTIHKIDQIFGPKKAKGIKKNEKRYPLGIKYGLIFIDQKEGRKILMDNHHPKGPHIHVDDQELPYKFINEEQLIKDFKALVLEKMEIKI